MSLDKLLKGVQTIAIICNQWGDTGKGKFSDYFSQYWADVIARGTGGNNAGHTIVVNGKERIFHLIPAGIIYDDLGKINILGNGMVIDLEALVEELEELEREGLSYNNLIISKDAHIVMPYHVERDRAKNQSQKKGGIGSTGRGIGPCYADKTARIGIKIRDLFDEDIIAKKIKKALSFYLEFDGDVSEILYKLQPFSERIKPFVRDTVSEMHRFVHEGKKILLEGAQGLLLSIEHGTYPYVTSSDSSLNGLASGVGLSAKAIDLQLGIVKFPFMTRVGGGPFPTELGADQYRRICRDPNYDKKFELEKYGISYKVIDGQITYNYQDSKIVSMMNSKDPFMKSIGIRLAAAEYGATTGRPRRIGWTDAVAAKYAVNINGLQMVLTKVDAIAGINDFAISYSYSDGENLYDDFNKDTIFLNSVTPKYHRYSGYSTIRDKKDYNNLPQTLKKAIEDFEKFTGGNVAIVSVGPEAEQTIVK